MEFPNRAVYHDVVYIDQMYTVSSEFGNPQGIYVSSYYYTKDIGLLLILVVGLGPNVI